jgi:hypothetical protein
VASEDLVYLFQECGVETGIDLDRACEAGGFMESVLKRRLPGRYLHNWQGQRERAAKRATAKSA